MSFLLKYRWPINVIFFAGLGLALSFIIKLDELKWYYIAGTPLMALVVGLINYFFTDTAWNKRIREKANGISLILACLFFIAFFLHLQVYNSGTFRYQNVNHITRTYIKGYTYNPIAQKYRTAHSEINSDAQLLYEAFGGIEGKTDVWTEESIQQTTLHFMISYAGAILLLSALMSWILGVAYEKKYTDPKKALESIMAEKEMSNYEKYLLTYGAKKSDERLQHIKLHVFLSYASEERKLAEEIFYSLTNNGHMVFFDRANLPAGLEYNSAIHACIMHSDIFIFLISPDAVADGHYTLSELKFAGEKSAAASGFLLPIMAERTDFEKIPAYAQSVTILISKGNLVAEVTSEVEKWYDAKSDNTKSSEL
jgi:hypothetical protein